jgi:tetratricopeptide (TPR) repeat protein
MEPPGNPGRFNCLVTPEGTLKITDFGLVKVLDDWRSPGRREGTLRPQPWQRFGKALGRLFEGDRSENQRSPTDVLGLATGTGLGGGTPAYMAPEQFDDMKSVDVRADIYSFGVMLFQMVTGQLPFDGTTWEELRRAHKETSAPDVSTNHRALGEGIRKCLSKRPAERFESFEAVNGWLSELYRRERGVPPPLEGEKEEFATDAIARAHNFWSLGMPKEAVVCCDEAIRSSPDSVEAWSLRGSILGVTGHAGEALQCHERAIAINGGSARVWHWMGVTRYWNGEFAEAVACYDRSLAIDPQSPQAWYDKGVSLQREGRIEEATACWSRCLALDPNHSMAWCNQGAGLADLGDKEAAISCYKRALDLNPRDEKAWYNLGQQLASHADRYAEALECLDMSERLGFQLARKAKAQIVARMKPERGKGPAG